MKKIKKAFIGIMIISIICVIGIVKTMASTDQFSYNIKSTKTHTSSQTYKLTDKDNFKYTNKINRITHVAEKGYFLRITIQKSKLAGLAWTGVSTYNYYNIEAGQNINADYGNNLGQGTYRYYIYNEGAEEISATMYTNIY